MSSRLTRTLIVLFHRQPCHFSSGNCLPSVPAGTTKVNGVRVLPRSLHGVFSDRFEEERPSRSKMKTLLVELELCVKEYSSGCVDFANKLAADAKNEDLASYDRVKSAHLRLMELKVMPCIICIIC